VRNLDRINPELLRPSKLSAISAFILLALTLLSVPLADGAAPNIPLAENPIAVLIFLILGVSSILTLASLIFRWGWNAKYYGISFLSFASVSYLGIVPCLAAVLYGTAPYWTRILIILVYGTSIFFWCRKFTVLYANTFNDELLRSAIYEEESDAVYYMRRGDEFLLEKHFKFSQMPRDRYFLLFIAIALLMIPVMSHVRGFIGIPFVHTFLLIAMLPVSWMSIGFAVRGYLIFYMYPAKIKKSTGKEVYVDLASTPRCRPLKRR
jgi:hypothetical protein